MPRKISLNAVSIGPVGDLGCEFSQVVIDGDITVPQTNVRRVIMPDEDIEAQCDNLDSYFEAQGYPKISAEDRATLTAIREAIVANPDFAARAEAWTAQMEAQRKAMEMPEPEPVEAPEAT